MLVNLFDRMYVILEIMDNKRDKQEEKKNAAKYLWTIKPSVKNLDVKRIKNVLELRKQKDLRFMRKIIIKFFGLFQEQITAD